MTGDIVNNGELTFDRSDRLTFSGAISGTGGVRQTGSGTTVLAGANSYTGATLVSAGTLRAGAAEVFGTDSATTVTAGATLDLAGFDQTLGSLAGAGSVTLGTARLTVGSDGSSTTFSGAISGSGALTKTGSGTTVLSGTNSYTGGTTITGGTLQLGDGGMAGSIAGDVANDGTLAFDRSDSLTFDGTISGRGGVRQIGSGTTVLTAANSYSGATTVEAGWLIVNGSTASSQTTVEPGATLGGTGTVGPLRVSGGTLAPGNSIGTLTVEGDLTFGSDGTYLVEVSPTEADRTDVTGTATLAGTVQVLAEPGAYAAGSRYLLLEATEGVSGRFDSLTSTFDYAFLEPALGYDANNVYLVLARNDVSFASIARSANQRAVGSAVDSLDAGEVFNAVAEGTTEQARQAFDGLSGELYASTASSLLLESRYVRETVTTRLRQASANSGTDRAALAPGSAVLASAPQSAASDADAPGAPSGDALPGKSGLTAWSRAIGSWGDLESDGNAAALDRSTAGVLLGLDAELDDTWTVGLAGGYSHSTLEADERASSGSVDSYHLAAYGGAQFGGLALRLGASYSWHDLETGRDIAFGSFTDSTSADYGGDTAQAFGEVGYALSAGDTALEPFAGLSYVNVATDSFTESGGAAALTSDGDSHSLTFSALGLRIAEPLPLGEEVEVTARGSLGWQHAFGDTRPSESLAFRDGGSAFAVSGVPVARDSALIEAGLELGVGGSVSLGVGYAGQLAANLQDHAVLGNLRIRF